MCQNPLPMREPRPSATFLLGAARSGTSLLYKVLCLHRDAAYFNNWLRRIPGNPSLSITNRVARHGGDIRRRVWFGDGSNAYVYGRRRLVGERLFPMPVEGEPVFAACGVPERGPMPADTTTAEQALRRTVAGVLRWGGGSVFLNKRIANNRRIMLLAQAFPNARFIDITRDGRAVASSLARVDWWQDSIVWWYGDTPAAWERSGGDPWKLCARNWVEEVRAIDAGLAEIHADRVLRLTYEQFVGDPTSVLTQVADFARLAYDPSWLSEVERLSFPNRNEGWRAQLDGDVISRIENVQADELRQRGYA